MPNLPENLDYNIIHGFSSTGSVTLRIFDVDVFSETQCEDASEVFRIDISLDGNKCNVEMTENNRKLEDFTIEDLTPDRLGVKVFATVDNMGDNAYLKL